MKRGRGRDFAFPPREVSSHPVIVAHYSDSTFSETHLYHAKSEGRSIIQERVRAGLHGMVSSAVFTRASCPAFLPGLPSKT